MLDTKKPYFGLTGKWLFFWITFSCATDMALFGYDQGVFSGVIVTQDFLEVHDLVGPTKTDTLSTVAAIYNVGCFIGAIVAFTLGERLGRKQSIVWGTGIILVGAVLQATSYSLPQIFVGRVVLGVGNGINTSNAPIWQTEISSAHLRGKAIMIEMLVNISGFVLANWINYGLSFVGGAVSWRFPIAFQLIFTLILFAIVPWLPESPRWLMAHGYQTEAVEVLSCLGAKSVDDTYISTQRNEIKYSIQYERANAVRWKDMFKRNKTNDTKTLRRLFLGAGTQFMQQFGGINVMSYYLPTVLINAVGLSNRMARLLTACNAVSHLIFACLAVLLIESLGRRGLMLVSTCGQLLCFTIITALLRYAEMGPSKTEVASASIVFFFLFYISFGLGMLGVPWLYPTEISSIPMRTKGAAIATATNWITNFVIVEITPIGIQNIGWKFWVIWVIFNALFLPIIYFFYPETGSIINANGSPANRTLEDLDAYYRSDPPLVVTGDPDAISVNRPLKY
ncbi:general substrate transporter [Aspergillus ellipticus CBS 707.79]|uniref:General substrate transporter n=1 Tax=Aspergillus ellipticus CBS 707.79 TaxID=1448320 RepID=A0A319CXQ9_9EURO|nr:general substrate transporter [Aspergillus ellipticus CBS 707.79]